MRLIINADDFGLSKSITDGIIEGIKGKYITSTTIMVNMEYAEYAIKQAIENNISCIGLHINLTVGKPIIKNKNLTDNEGKFLYNKLQIENEKLTYEDAYDEIMAQIEKVNELSDGKIKVDHLDSHHGLCKNNNIRQAIIDIANKLEIPIRREQSINEDIVKCPDIYYNSFSMKNISIEKLKEMVEEYKSQNIIVELLTHPGYIDEYTKSITSCLTREEELSILKDAKYQGIYSEIKLISFSDF